MWTLADMMLLALVFLTEVASVKAARRAPSDFFVDLWPERKKGNDTCIVIVRRKFLKVGEGLLNLLAT